MSRWDRLPGTGRSEQSDRSAVTILDEVGTTYWTYVAALTAIAMQFAAILQQFLGRERPVLSADSALYQHGGWRMVNGGVPYVDIWDAKPPLAFEIPAVIALFTGWDPYVQHLVTVGATSAAAIGIVLLAGLFVHDLTSSWRAAFLAALAGVSFPYLFYYPANGFRPKIFMIVFGLAGLYLARQRRSLAAGALTAGAAGLWQLAIVFPLLALGVVHQRGDRRESIRCLGGMAGVTLLVVAPIVLAGGGEEMVVEVVLIPLTDKESHTLLEAVTRTVFMFGFAAPVVGLGIAGIAYDTWRAPRERWWLGALGLWFLLQVYVDLNYFPDVFPLFAVSLVGLGVLVSKWPLDGQATVAVAVGVVLVLNPLLALGAFTDGAYLPNELAQRTLGTGADSDSADLPEPYYNVSQQEFLNTLYWERQIPEYCHYRFGKGERTWLQLTNRTHESPCGKLPDNWIRILT